MDGGVREPAPMRDETREEYRKRQSAHYQQQLRVGPSARQWFILRWVEKTKAA